MSFTYCFAFTELGFVLAVFCVFIGSIFVADLSYRIIEKPFVAFARRILGAGA